ncbi:PD-(D/E)XK nuclease family protein [bacterium]|nr:PD-(D/E)XK nuclease family protein [bacterium]
MANRLPFQIFPGIFSSIDSYNKNLVHSWFDKYKCEPTWLSVLGNFKDYVNPPHYSKFNIINHEYNILLTGSPDGVFIKTDNSYVIVDYKTAKYTGTQDNLFPMYVTQLNVYALIGKQFGFNPISGLALIYMEPITDKDSASNDENQNEDGFSMNFSANIHKVVLNTDIISPLLYKTRELYELDKPPEGLSECKDCINLDGLLTLMK